VSYRNSLTFFYKQQENLSNFIADPTHYAVMVSERAKANTLRNDLSMALKSYVEYKWDNPNIVIPLDAAYRLNMEYVFVVVSINLSSYVRLKARGTRAPNSTAVAAFIDSATAFDCKDLDLFEATCICLSRQLITEPVLWTGAPSLWHRALVEKHKLEVYQEETTNAFRLF